MATYTAKVLSLIKGLLSNTNMIPKVDVDGSLIDSKLSDSGTVLSYNGQEVTDARTQRKKSEVYYSGVSVVLTAGTTYNLVSILKVLTATSGALLPFFDTSGNKLKVINDNASCYFKLNVVGNWANASSDRSIQVDFVGTNGNRLVANRSSATTADSLTLATFLSVDKNGNIATNGSTVNITAVGINFTITSALLIAEQVTKESF